MLWSECAPPPNSDVEILRPVVMVFGSVVFGSWLGHRGGALVNGISALLEESPENSLLLHHVRTQQENVFCEAGGGPHQTGKLPGSRSQTSRLQLCEKHISVVCQPPVYGTLLEHQEQTDRDSSSVLLPHGSQSYSLLLHDDFSAGP